MSWHYKTILLVMMTAALACGFLHHLVPRDAVNFERLHIFLFNLCSGGSMLLYFTEGEQRLSARTRLFLLFAVAFAFCAFFQLYLAASLIPLFLAYLVEQVRIDHFGSRFPRGLFLRSEPVPRKFHQAALLCLSVGLGLAGPVILNSVYLKWFSIEKLRLDTFFLGFSFPVSLISMSVIFTLMKKGAPRLLGLLKEAAFWIINMGVIVFFLFILAGLFTLQVAIALVLFVTVAFILYLYWHEGMPLQQKAFLTSGIFFLLITSLTGIVYILLTFTPYYTAELSHPLLRLHAFTALYGWNLSGLAVISRHEDFPLKLHSRDMIVHHWLTVLVLCPLGYFYPLFAVLAVLAYGWLLIRLLFNKGTVDRQLTAIQDEHLYAEPTSGHQD